MEFGPVTKLDKRNKATSKKIYDDVMLENCDAIAVFQTSVFQKLDSGCLVCKDYVFLRKTFHFTKNETELKNL